MKSVGLVSAVALLVMSITLWDETCGHIDEPVKIDGPTDKVQTTETRECLRTKGPQNNESCNAFEQRWLNKSDAKILRSNITTTMEGVSKKDVVVTIGCYGLYTFSQEMIGACADPKLLLDLLLCQYDYLDNKTVILSQFHNVKTRDDIINWMSDFKKCIGTTSYPPPVEEDSDSTEEIWGSVDVISIFIEPAKQMRAYIEKNNL